MLRNALQLNEFAVLELPCPLPGPALDHDLFLRKEFHCVHALSVHVAEERILPSAKWEERHRCGDTDIDPDVSRLRFVPELARRRSTGCEQAGLISVLSTVDQLDRFIHRVDMHQTQYRSEDLGFGDFTAARDICQNSGTHKTAALVALDGSPASIYGDSCSLFDAEFDQRLRLWPSTRR